MHVYHLNFLGGVYPIMAVSAFWLSAEWVVYGMLSTQFLVTTIYMYAEGQLKHLLFSLGSSAILGIVNM